MKTKSLKRLTSVLLVIVMCFSLLPMTTLAAWGDTGVFSENLDSEPVTYIVGDEADSLEVSAETADDEAVSYQWYSNTEKNTENGIPIKDATKASYTPSTEEAGISYYYVIAADETASVSIASNIAEIIVSEPADEENEITEEPEEDTVNSPDTNEENETTEDPEKDAVSSPDTNEENETTEELEEDTVNSPDTDEENETTEEPEEDTVNSPDMDEENETTEEPEEASDEGAFSSLTISTSQRDPTKVLTLEPEFSSDITEYDVTVPDTASSVWVKAVKSNPDHKTLYTNYPYASGAATYSFSSGSWKSMSTGVNSKDNRNKLHLYVGPYSIMDSPGRWQQDDTLYTITFWRQLSLSSLNIAEATTDLDRVFNKDTLNYTVSVPADAETVNITPTSSSNAFTYDLEVNGISVESGKTVEITPDWDKQGRSQVTVDLGYTVNDAVGNYDINAVPTTYTITLIKEGLSDEPLMLTQPKSAVYLDKVAEVEPLTVKATANGELSYQWYSNTENSDTGGTLIPDAMEMEYIPEIGHVEKNEITYYYCEVANGSFTTKSNVASVTVKPDPSPDIINITESNGSSLDQNRYDYDLGEEGMELKVNVKSRVDGGVWSYKWMAKNGLDGNGSSRAVSDEETVVVDTSADGIKRYECEVTYTVDGVDYSAISQQSPPFYVTATSASEPIISVHPQSAEYVVKSTAVSDLKVSASRSDSGTLSYQWYSGTDKDDKSTFKAISGATSPIYKLTVLEEPGSIFYYCAVKNTVESISGKTYESKVVESDIAEIKFYAPDFSGWEGEGTADSPFLIKNQDDLINLRDKVNSGESLFEYHFKMMDDITLPDEWVPIGALKTGETATGNGRNIWPFSGNFDGGDYTITVPSGGLPIFGYVRYASVKNLNIYGPKISGYGLVDNFTVDYGSTGNYNKYIEHGYPVTIDIDNVTIKTGTSTLKAGFIGGFASGANVVNIKNCTAESGVTIGYDKNQLQIGSFAGTLSGTMENCVSYADVYGTNTVGGLVGSKGEAMGSCVIKNSIFAGKVIAADDYAGGICGKGYRSSTAPNAPVVSIQNCYVTGSVAGSNYVGGILGAEPAVYQAWENGAGYIQNNFFLGSLNATNGTYVGGIIGYMKSMDRYNVIENNFYLDTSADKGIGFANIIDTDCDVTTSDPAIRYINTKGNSSTTPIDGISFRADCNRSDDPMGKEAHKLAKAATAEEFKDGTVMESLIAGKNGRSWKQGAEHPEFGSGTYITEVTASGYKTKYYRGDSFTTEGMTLVVKYSDGTTLTVTDLSDVAFHGFDSTEVGEKKIIGEYGNTQFSFNILVIYAPPSNGQKYKATISVTDPGATGSQTKTYFPMTTMELNEGETAFSLLERTGLRLRTSSHSEYAGVYVEAINGFGEFDDGELSGWMYKVNGVFPEYSSSLYILRDGDEVEWVYTRDLGKDVGNRFSGRGTETDGIAEPNATVKDGKGSVTLDLKDIKDAIGSAKGKKDAVIIAPKVSGTVKSMEVSLSKEALKEIIKQTDSPLIIKTPVGNITIPNSVLESIHSQATGKKVMFAVETIEKDVLTAEQREIAGDKDVFNIYIQSGEKYITGFDGKNITISLPYTLKGDEKAGDIDVWYLDNAGEIKKMSGTYDQKTKLATFETSHLSYYLVGIEIDQVDNDDFIMNFEDVKESDWFYKAVEFVVKNSIFKGTGETTFSPNEPMTRAMLVTVLYRMEDSPAPNTINNFTDVESGEWYSDAILWANTNNIASGYGNGQFGTDDPITREQMAAVLYHYASYKGYDVSDIADLSSYDDSADISSWAQTSMGWANAKGLIIGRTAATIVPKNTATRAEVASILQRFVEDL